VADNHPIDTKQTAVSKWGGITFEIFDFDFHFQLPSFSLSIFFRLFFLLGAAASGVGEERLRPLNIGSLSTI
jgi:hypothetical protein